MSDRITYMHSGQIGAPQMNGAAGSNGQMLQVLDDCLINGFNSQTVTMATKTATTVTLTFGVSHGYAERQLLLITGASDAALNGQHRVIAKTNTTVTIDAVGVSVTTGTITTKVAPLGWESIFGSNDALKRAYRSINPDNTKTVLYLDMTLPTGHGYNAANPIKRAAVSMCEDMTSLGVQINSYTDVKNNYGANPNGSLFWYQARGDAKDAAVNSIKNRSWVVVGNEDYFYFLTDWQTTNDTWIKQRDLFGFGDVPSIDKNDNYNCFWIGAYVVNDATSIYQAANGAKINSNPNNFNYNSESVGTAHGFFISSASGTGDLQSFSLSLGGILYLATMNLSGYKIASPLTYLGFPNANSQSLIIAPLYSMTLGASYSLRSEMGCLMAVTQDLADNKALDLNVVGETLLVATATDGVYKTQNGFFAINMGD